MIQTLHIRLWSIGFQPISFNCKAGSLSCLSDLHV
jgi:hypothetical protein